MLTECIKTKTLGHLTRELLGLEPERITLPGQQGGKGWGERQAGIHQQPQSPRVQGIDGAITIAGQHRQAGAKGLKEHDSEAFLLAGEGKQGG